MATVQPHQFFTAEERYDHELELLDGVSISTLVRRYCAVVRDDSTCEINDLWAHFIEIADELQNIQDCKLPGWAG
jgi:hypothetical protein